MREQGARDLSREMGAALRKAAEPVQESIRHETEEAMPRRGGYRSVLSRSLRFRTSRREGSQTATFRVITYADGTRERRDIRALNNSKLRHPVYGRSRRIRSGHRAGTILANPWAVTSVHGGFFQRGTEQALAGVEDALLQVIQDYADRLVK
jgi:hypothetical protein